MRAILLASLPDQVRRLRRVNTFRVALAQINTVVGDFEGNTTKVLEYVEKAKTVGADLVAFPELAVNGYPPEDLLLKPHFASDGKACLDRIAQASQDIVTVVGFVDANSDVHNAAAVLSEGRVAGIYHKIFLPNYGVFDEDRYFKAGTSCPVFDFRGVRIGVNICEDIWYALGPAVVQKEMGAQVIVTITASPYSADKLALRETFLATRALDNEIFVCYVNLVGGQDELVFDGATMVFGPAGEMIARAKQFEEDFIVSDLDVASLLRRRLRGPLLRKQRLIAPKDDLERETIQIPGKPSNDRPALRARKPEAVLGREAEVYSALVLGTRDYVGKNGFKRVIVGLSGGVDSSLVATVAADALGPEGVVGVAMPSRYNAPESEADARALAANLGIEFHVIPIEDMFKAGLGSLKDVFRDTQPNVAEENLQARIRGNVLMAISNKFGWLVLTTGNKSEMAMGYATLYGDMAGGFAVIKDVPKTLVYDLCRYRNGLQTGDVVPQSVLDKPPTAELRPNQKDEDSLPPYPILDPILQAYVEEDRSYEEMIGMGFEEARVKQVISAVDRAEYKRRQAPPGVKITPRAFGRDRRLPIVNRYKAY